MKDYKEKAAHWLSEVFDKDTRAKVQDLIDNDPRGLEESFYQDLKFGTGGMRGVMGVGTNRINKYTLGKNTQGIANYLKQEFPGREIKVAIAYDCRHNSNTLAGVVADVFSANGIKVFLFSELRPTPELSFAVRYLHCQCGIVLTASHNPPEYNGYKVYWEDGGQLVMPKDEEVIRAIAAVDYKDIRFEQDKSLIEEIGAELDKAFINMAVEKTSFGLSAAAKSDLKIVYTSLHGTSIKIMPGAFAQAGFTNVHVVEEQAVPNGDFPTVASPNPEEPAALKMALELADRIDADLVVGTDPDADRLGVAVRDLNGEMVLLNGNQTMVLMTDFLLQNGSKKGFKGNEFIASTVVSTPLMKKLAAHYGVICKTGLTGFKWIAKMIKDYTNLEFIGGGEESFGFMVGDSVRDKDSISSILLAAQMAARAKSEGSSLYKTLLELYLTHGLYQERMVALVKKGIAGAQEIKQMMKDLRRDPLTQISGIAVESITDLEISERVDVKTGKRHPVDIPRSNVLIYDLEDGSMIAARPSGTEPKIKFYVSVNQKMSTLQELESVQNRLNRKIDDLLGAFGL